jgi:nitrate reductase cytochrome c-type subunit
VIIVAGCQSGVKTGDLTDDEQKKLAFVTKQNVASFGAPPMIPADHDFVVGEDIFGYENGGDACLDCHGDDSDEDIPQTSHPERHNCIQCHLPQLDDTSAEGDFKVDNSFTKYDPGAAR